MSRSTGSTVIWPITQDPPVVVTPSNEYLRLISKESIDVYIRIEVSDLSPLLKNLRTCSPFTKHRSNGIFFPDIPYEILKIVCLYMMHRRYYSLHPVMEDALPEFPIPPHLAMEVHGVAHYFNV